MRYSTITSTFALLLLFCASGSAVAAKTTPPCTRAQAEKAEAEADQLKGGMLSTSRDTPIVMTVPLQRGTVTQWQSYSRTIGRIFRI
jgi:hypothetical protein